MPTNPQSSASSNIQNRSGQNQSGQNQSGKSESARQATRTWAFVAAAIGCLLITGLFEWLSRPAEIKEYGKVGQEFYPEFTDPTTATSLSVAVIDPEEVKPLEFSVTQAENGQWVIPSHHNYPADAADQLAKTASSVIGIKRGAMVTRWPSDHARYGVVDPQTDSVGIDELEGIGKRITLGGKDGTVLASYIVGKKVEGEGNRYYVRHPGEDETYIADLDINLTTRFRDWVNTDLLDIASTDVRRVELNDYSFDEIRGTVTGNIQSVLSRDSSSDDWKLAGINEATEQVNADAVRETLDTLTNLEIAGVRPKQPGLTADLRIDRNALKSQRDADRLTNDLLARGFLLQPNPDDPNLLELIAREGEMFVGTDDGLLYRLYFGRVFTGSDQELEIGLNTDDGESEDDAAAQNADAKKADKEPEGDKEATGDEAPKADNEKDNADADKDSPEATGKPGRYVFVRVNLDPTLLGEVLTEPVAPQEPEEIKTLEEKIKQAEADKSDADKSEPDTANPDTANPDAEAGDAEPKAAEETDAQKLQRLRQEFASATMEYRDRVSAFEEYQRKLKDGEKKSEELNRRFALWYYVIPGESYDKLSLNREDLIQAKEAPEGAEPADAQANDNALPTIGELSEAVMKESASLQAPENTSGESPEAAKVEPPADQPPAEPTPADQPPAETTPPAAEPAEPATDNAEVNEPADSQPADSQPAAESPSGDEPAGDGAAEPETPDPDATDESP